MGWSYVRRERGISNKDFLQDLVGDGYTVLDTYNERLNVLHAAVRTPEDHVIAFTMLSLRINDYFNFGYKLMTEGSGPYVTGCSKRILDQLTPVPEAYSREFEMETAQAWRDACYKEANRIAALPKVKLGDIIRFKHEIRFRDGRTVNELEFIKGSSFKIPGQPFVKYRLERKWRRERQWEIVDPNAVAGVLTDLPAAGATEDDYSVGSRIFSGFNGLFTFKWIASTYDAESDIVSGYCINIDDPLFSEFGTIYGRELMAQSFSNEDCRDKDGNPVPMVDLIKKYEPQIA